MERTPTCAVPDFELSTTTVTTETVHVQLTVVSDGSPTVSSSERDPSTCDRLSTTYQAGRVVSVTVDGELYVPDWAAMEPCTRSAGLSSTTSVQPA